MKQTINDFVLSNWQQLKEAFSIISIIIVSLMIKNWKRIQDKAKFTYKWLISEAVMSTVVAGTCYLIFDKWLHLDKFLVCVICTWAGAMSTKFHANSEGLLDYAFDWVKSLLSMLKPKNMIILFTIGLLLFASCGKKPIESTHTIENNTTLRHDTKTNREISKAIIDSLFLKISKVKTAKPECDSITNAEIQKLLRQIASLKKSGNNELGFYYDEIKNMLVAYGKVDKSINESIETLKDLKAISVEKEKIEIPVKYIPKWVQVLAWLGGLLIIGFILWICKKFALW